MTGRRVPPPGTVIEHAESFWVQDSSGQTVGWFYFRTDPLVAKTAGVPLKDGARRMAVNFARLPELLGVPGTTGPRLSRFVNSHRAMAAANRRINGVR